ncbi:hypothetical protein GCK72_020264 [Caenorhabditis remanei]|uniref:Glutaredoxin domain-containing protein n=1 Tax=Caenorhabditis remanei TaxID=31234 RepID=A0A6A5GEN3_CAERE|nr:hypothetical protein GCK72_020264 [Caenorhabditis remanei]KAF1753707.1 hypothetical protein GCK72_020264 [Caenorhabditis remanei]
MGSYFAKNPSEYVMSSEFETESEEEEDLEIKLTILRDAMIHLRVQFLHFQSVYKQSEADLIENDVKALKIIVMVVQNRIEELKSIAVEYTELKNMEVVRQKIEDFDYVVTQVVMEIREFERDNFLIEKLEKLINKLNPFDVPNLQNLDQKTPIHPKEMIKSVMNNDSKKYQEQLKKEKVQSEEENEIRHDNSKILSGQRKIYKIFRKPVVLLVNYLEDSCTLKAMQILNENQIDYSIFDVSTDAEVRLIVKYLSDCETFPQLFVKGSFEKLAAIDSLIETLPKLYVN